MPKSLASIALLAALSAHAALSASPAAQVPTPATAAMSTERLQATMQQYCVTCHSNRTKTGGLSLEGVDYADVGVHADVLEKAARKLLVGAMPPQGAPRPAAAELLTLRTSLEAALDRAASTPNPGRAILRRLNRTEYANAVRDLLDLDINVSTLLPVDNSSYGFDNIGDVLGVSPVLMERYLTAARRISAVAVGEAADIITTADTYKVKPDTSQDRHIEGLPLGTRGGLLVTHTFPLDAEYSFTVDLRQATLNNVVGLEYPHVAIVTLDGAEIHRAALGGKDDLTLSYANSQAAAEALEARLAVRTKVTAGPHRVGVTFLAKGTALRAGFLQPYERTTWDPVDYRGEPHIEAMAVTGPFNATAAGDTPSRRRIFTCRPPSPSGLRRDEPPTGTERACAKQILSGLAERAYRRPLTPADVATLERFYRLGAADGGFESGIAMGLRRILASPDFVLRVERDPEGARPGSIRPVTDLELASRLSFFLWSSAPDSLLMADAVRGRLHQPAVFDRHLRRMLTAPRARALVDNFAGQWLYLRNLRTINPAPDEFPDFDDNLRQAMRREVELLFESIIREDRSVVDLLTAPDTFVNERLARHYGIPNIRGSHFRRVTLEQDERRGLLGKGAILVVSSLATRTSPVARGKWVLENIIGTPPPPPPPDVPALDETGPGQRPRSLRERTEAHRRAPTCAACHRVMDPIGFALEPFDAVGQKRTSDGGAPIDAKGVLMDGSAVDGPASLRDALARTPEIFVTTMTEKLLIYALGRGLQPADHAAVRAIVSRARASNYRFSALVAGIAASTPFRMKTVDAAGSSGTMAVAR
jgi:mono/diheme cytochrome c family protein